MSDPYLAIDPAEGAGARRWQVVGGTVEALIDSFPVARIQGSDHRACAAHSPAGTTADQLGATFLRRSPSKLVGRSKVLTVPDRITSILTGRGEETGAYVRSAAAVVCVSHCRY